jgi:hypothetical protein
MEYGKIVELTQEVFGYETIEEAGVAVGKLLYSGSSDRTIANLVSVLTNALADKEKN